MGKRKLFTDEQVDMANSINILEYARRAGHHVEQVTPREFKISSFGGLRIDGKGQQWNCFSAQKGGGPIQFVMFTESKSWVEAVKQLLGLSVTLGDDQSQLYRSPYKAEEVKGELILPEKNNTYKHVFAYLTQTRKIDKNVVSSIVKQKKLYENSHRSCVFVGYDREGTPKYASVRSTNTTGSSYRGDVANSDKTWAFRLAGTSQTIRVFEAPIDALSYATLLKHHGINAKDHMLALGCLGDTALKQYLADHPEINKIIFCVDNDQWGRKAVERWTEQYEPAYSIVQHFPQGKDWNEDLISFVREKERGEMDSELDQLEEAEL